MRQLFTSEVIYGDRILKKRVVACHDGDSAVGDKKLLPVSVRIKTDGSAFGDVHISVNDGAPQTAVAADIHVRKENARVYFGIGIYPHIGRQHAIADGSA